jgi:CDP-paratose 2-epimerase
VKFIISVVAERILSHYFEAIDLIEKITGEMIKHDFGPPREGDHIWWITNISKVKSHYPHWDVSVGLREIFKEIYESLIEHGLNKK